MFGSDVLEMNELKSPETPVRSTYNQIGSVHFASCDALRTPANTRRSVTLAAQYSPSAAPGARRIVN